MKYFIVLVVVVLVAWRWRIARTAVAAPKPSAKSQAQPTDMVACRHCGLHLPTAESLRGQQGMYCSPAHRHAAEG